MDYDDIVHFCEHNTIEVIARQMSKDVQEIERLRAENEALRSLLVRVQVAIGRCPTSLMQDIDKALSGEE